MSAINQELEALLLKYQTQSDLLSSQINELRAKKQETDEIVKQFQKMLGITPSRVHTPTNIHRKPEFVDMTITDAVITVLRRKDGQTRTEIAKAIALDNPKSVKLVQNSLHNADRMASFHEHFNYEQQKSPDHGSIKLKKIFWLKETAIVQPPVALSIVEAKTEAKAQPVEQSQVDIFADMGDFTKKQVEKHYPKKAAVMS